MQIFKCIEVGTPHPQHCSMFIKWSSQRKVQSMVGESIINHPTYHSTCLLEAQASGQLNFWSAYKVLEIARGYRGQQDDLCIQRCWKQWGYGDISMVFRVWPMLSYSTKCSASRRKGWWPSWGEDAGAESGRGRRNSPAGGVKGKCKGCERARGFQKGVGSSDLVSLLIILK